MIPILCDKQYHGTGADFRIGKLPSWIDCAVTEEKNGEFVLEGTLPVGAMNVDQLAIDRIIMSAAAPPRSYYSDTQPFRIRALSKPAESDQIHLVAQHASYQLSDKIIRPDFRLLYGFWDSVQDIFNQYLNVNAPSGSYVIPAMGGAFTFESDITTQEDVSFKHLEPMSVKAFLLSVLETFGGEFDWDGWAVRLKSARGTVRDVSVEYGKNLATLKYDTDAASMVNGYFGFWQGDGSAYTDGILYENGYSEWAFPRLEVVDLSNEIAHEGSGTPTAQEIASALSAYAETQNAGILPTSITVTAVPSTLQSVHLCDTITVIHPGYQLRQPAQIVKTVFDPIRERYTAVTIGEIQKGITDTIAMMLEGGYKSEFTGLRV